MAFVFKRPGVYSQIHTLLLYGGGIDSTTLLKFLAEDRFKRQTQVSAVFFRYGQKAQALEEQACRYFCNKYQVELHVVDTAFASITDSAIMAGGELANDPSINILDGRNLTLIGMAGMLGAKIKATHLALGFHIEPVARPFPDASPEFFDAMSNMMRLAFKHKMELCAPFSEATREEIFAYARNHDSEILTAAHTCYEDVPGGCGKCSHCLLKQQITSGWSV